MVAINRNIAVASNVGVQGEILGKEPELRSTTNPLIWGWQGLAYDPGTGNYDNKARQYNQNTGAFTSQDSSGIAGGINFYGSRKNNPLTYTDPNGEDALLVFLAPAFVFEATFDATTFVTELAKTGSVKKAARAVVDRSPLNNLFDVGINTIFPEPIAGPVTFFANPATYHAVDQLKNRNKNIDQQLQKQCGEK